jgi:hypothetical protein
MAIAALILGIIGGIAGLVGAGFALVVGGLGSAFSASGASTVLGGAVAAVVFSVLGIVGGALSLKWPKTAGGLMLVAAVGGGIGVFVAYAVAFPLLLVGGILALVSSRSSVPVSSVGAPTSGGTRPVVFIVLAVAAVLFVGGAVAFLAALPRSSAPVSPPAATSAAPAPSGDTAAAPKPLDLAIGQSAEYSGLSVTLVSAGAGPNDLGGKPTYKLSVAYKNNGTASATFNPFDWKLEDGNGARTQNSAFISGSPTLGTGDIAPGGSTSGDIYFTPGASVAKIVYQPSIFSGENNLATWKAK